MTRHRVQNLVMPSLTFGAPEEMYVRLSNDHVVAFAEKGKLVFSAGGRASFDTFFNGLTLGIWHKRFGIEDVTLVLKGRGRFLVRLGIHRLGISHRWLIEREVTLDEEDGAAIHLASLEGHDDGMLYASVIALSEGELSGGGFETSTEVKTTVRLGIVVTHFNRVKYVTTAIERLRKELLNDPFYRDKIKLVVVDNSRNLSSDSDDQVTILPNENYGGSGGFTRGLMHLQDNTAATHCLFMDDDASCEVESIRRTLHMLEFAGASRLAVSGALLRELEPYRLYEKGAAFANGKLHPHRTNLDMRQVGDLLWAEKNDLPVDYGAWWHFAFALHDVRHCPYPFFVRGDDVLFSLQNKFDIVTLNGVASWGEDFHYKDSPMTRYLAVRSEILLALDSPSVSRWECVKGVTRSYGASLFSYNYASARAITMAVEDVLRGPDFWVENLDAAKPRAKVAEFAGPEKMRPMSMTTRDVERPTGRQSRLWTALRWATLNGVLIPTALMKNKTVYQSKFHRARLRDIFLYRRVLYMYEPTGLGYVAEHDKGKFFTELFRFLKQVPKIVWHYQDLRTAYLVAMDYCTQRQFWEDVYSERGHAEKTSLEDRRHTPKDVSPSLADADL